MEKTKLKKIVFIIYIFLILYSLEILTYFFIIPEEQKLLTDIQNSRIKIAETKKIQIDKRTKIKAFLDERDKISELDVNFYFNKDFEQYSTFQNSIQKQTIIPFRGPINKLTLSCNEELKYLIINNDKYGFKNSNQIYENEISIAILGDSYAEGLCQDNENDISGHLIKQGINSINLGITGSGPLISLAITREYIQYFNPKLVVYLYFEGNDLNDLEWEINQEYLVKYLDTEFKRDYLNNQKYLITFLNLINNEQRDFINQLKINDPIFIDNKKSANKEIFKDLRELTNIRNLIKNAFIKDQQIENLDNLFMILKKMENEVSQLNKEFLFIYIPSWERYFTKANKNKKYFNQKKKIINFLKNNRIKYIDFDKELKKEENLSKYFPLEFVGHYNSKGYEKISNLIKDKFESSFNPTTTK